MKIVYGSKVKKYLEDEKSIKRKYGLLSNQIIVALSVLQFSINLSLVPNVPPTRRHKLSGNYEGCWAIDLSKSWRMILKPNSPNLELFQIEEVEIVDICDYH